MTDLFCPMCESNINDRSGEPTKEQQRVQDWRAGEEREDVLRSVANTKALATARAEGIREGLELALSFRSKSDLYWADKIHDALASPPTGGPAEPRRCSGVYADAQDRGRQCELDRGHIGDHGSPSARPAESAPRCGACNGEGGWGGEHAPAVVDCEACNGTGKAGR